MALLLLLLLLLAAAAAANAANARILALLLSAGYTPKECLDIYRWYVYVTL